MGKVKNAKGFRVIGEYLKKEYGDRTIIATGNANTPKGYIKHALESILDNGVEYIWYQEGDVHYLIPSDSVRKSSLVVEIACAVDDYGHCLAYDTFEDTPVYQEDDLDIVIQSSTKDVLVLGITNESAIEDWI